MCCDIYKKVKNTEPYLQLKKKQFCCKKGNQYQKKCICIMFSVEQNNSSTMQVLGQLQTWHRWLDLTLSEEGCWCAKGSPVTKSPDGPGHSTRSGTEGHLSWQDSYSLMSDSYQGMIFVLVAPPLVYSNRNGNCDDVS